MPWVRGHRAQGRDDSSGRVGDAAESRRWRGGQAREPAASRHPRRQIASASSRGNAPRGRRWHLISLEIYELAGWYHPVRPLRLGIGTIERQ